MGFEKRLLEHQNAACVAQNILCRYGHFQVALSFAVRLEVLTMHLPVAGYNHCSFCVARLGCGLGCIHWRHSNFLPNRARTWAATQAVMQALQRAGFILSNNSVTRPRTSLRFLGKMLNSRDRTMSNEVPMRLWLLAAGRGRLHPRTWHLCWAACSG